MDAHPEPSSAQLSGENGSREQSALTMVASFLLASWRIVHSGSMVWKDAIFILSLYVALTTVYPRARSLVWPALLVSITLLTLYTWDQWDHLRSVWAPNP